MSSPRSMLAALGLAGCLAVAGFATTTPAPPAETGLAAAPAPVDERWDPRIHELVRFAEDARGPIRRPARLEFIDRDELITELQGRPIPSGDANPIGQALARLDDMDRALGLANGEWGQEDIARSLSDGVAAFYDPSVPRVVVAIDGAEPDELDPTTRVILSHELVHAFQGNARLSKAASFLDLALSQAVVEGEAEWVLERYVASLPADDQQAWRTFVAERRSSVRSPASIIDARLSQSYELGYRLHRAAEDLRGEEMFDLLIGGAAASNRSTASLIDPYSFETDAVGDYAGNSPDSAVQFEGVGVFHSAATWFRVFATAVPPVEALEAARGTTSVRTPNAELLEDDSLCITAAVLPRNGAREQVLAAAEAWAARLREHRSVRTLGLDVELVACDPGPGAVPEPELDPLDATMWLARFIDAEAWLVDQGRDRSAAACVIAQLGDAPTGFDVAAHERQFTAADLDRC